MNRVKDIRYCESSLSLIITHELIKVWFDNQTLKINFYNIKIIQWAHEAAIFL